MMLAIDKFGHLHGFDTRRQQRLNFVTVGLVDGLGSVRGTPRTGWTPRVGIFENAGYICRSGRPFRRSYVPLYVCTLIRDAAGMVTAIELSCRYPPGTTLA